MQKPLLCSIAALLVASTTTANAADVPVQSVHVRTMVVTCKIDETIKFYTEVLGQKIFDDTGPRKPRSADKIIKMGNPPGMNRKVIFEGSGNYPGGNVSGSRIGFLGMVDTSVPACKNKDAPNEMKMHGGVVMPMRVANLQEIAKRAKAMGIEFIQEPQPSPSRLTMQALLYDPNGIVLELFELNNPPIPQ